MMLFNILLIDGPLKQDLLQNRLILGLEPMHCQRLRFDANSRVFAWFHQLSRYGKGLQV